MANGLDAYFRGMQGAMQQGQNALAMSQAVQKMQRDKQLRNILAGAYKPPQAAIPGMAAAPAEGPLQPGAQPLPDYPAQAGVPAQPGGLDIKNALGAMYQGGFGPEAMQFEAQQAKLAGTTPSAVNEWNFYRQLPKAEQEKYLTMKRAQKFLDIGSGFVAPSQVSPTQTRDVAARQLKPTEQVGYISEKASEQKKAQVKGEAQAKAQIGLPDAEMQLEKTKSLTEQILNHPGLESSFGKMGLIPAIPGSDKANFQSLKTQMQDNVFISNRQALKGGGAITDFEGTKAENAALRAMKAQSAEAFKKAVKEHEYWAEKGFEKMRRAAKGDFSVKEIKIPTPQSDAEYNALPSGSLFIDPDDGKQYRKP